FHELQAWKFPSEILTEIIDERRLFESALARRRYREPWARMRFLVDQARAWVDAGGSGLPQFVEWAVTQSRERADAL
ncbi:hypothetical protein Q8G50_34980, partial [Klebsiella pneumoniae]